MAGKKAGKSMFSHPDPYGGAGYAEGRTSAPLTEGHASPSTGDHGVGQGRSSFLAAHHPDLKQSNTSFDQVITRLQTVNGDGNGDRSTTYTAGEVGLRMFNAAGQAGHYHDMAPVDPSPQRPDWHTARNSATPPNGSHSTGRPLGNAPMAAKSGSEQLEVMKQTMRFPGRGAR
jgi:hypothetical protein